LPSEDLDPDGMNTPFLRVIEVDDKPTALSTMCLAGAGQRDGRHDVDTSSFAAIPGAPFTYWVSDRLRSLFVELRPFGSSGRITRQGGICGDDFRWLRQWTEPAHGDRYYLAFVKGGAFRSFYSDLPLVVDWDRDRGTFNAFTGLPHRPSLKPASADYYLLPGLTFPRRPHRRGSFSVVPSNCLFADNGPMAFVPIAESFAWLAVLNAAAFHGLVQLMMARGQGDSAQTLTYEVGMVARTPVPDLTPADETALASLARRAWSLKRNLDTRTETSHAFILPALLQTEARTLATRSAAWTERVQAGEAELAAIQAEIDERCFTLYGIDEEDRRAITEGFGGSSPDAETAEEAEGDTEDEAEAEAAADTATLAAELVSWAAGVAFGRFDVRLATGARELPAEPEPFDPLPVCSPAMLTGADGLPLPRPPVGYPLPFPEDGILVDDPGHPRDLTAAVRAVFDTVFGASADAIWQEAAALLDPKGHDLRTWLATGFFGHHLGRHSKSRRKAPILWQLGPASARYSTWVYAHRLTRDSLFALARDVVIPKLALEERRQTSLVQEAGPNSTAKQRAEIAAQDAVVAELRVFAEEVRWVAPLWNPDLDDGIVLVEAPLWRLVPHKPWAKELKSRWDDLAAGKYDWAHTAMHLWPERVVPTCATDRSLAIAHGLEDVFWAEGADGRWTKRARPTRPVEELVAERTSPAVKAALADLLAAPAPAAAGRGRGRSS
jgi:hypothetical protein